MANKILIQQGSQTTPTFTLSGLTNTSKRQSASVNLGTDFAQRISLQLSISFASAPAANNTVDLFLAYSDDGTDFDGGCSGSDAVYAGNEQQLHYIGSFVTAAQAEALQMTLKDIYPASQYIAIVASNQSGQTLSTSSVTVIPLEDEIQ